jgi:hypothetical protein
MQKARLLYIKQTRPMICAPKMNTGRKTAPFIFLLRLERQ